MYLFSGHTLCLNSRIAVVLHLELLCHLQTPPNLSLLYCLLFLSMAPEWMWLPSTKPRHLLRFVLVSHRFHSVSHRFLSSLTAHRFPVCSFLPTPTVTIGFRTLFHLIRTKTTFSWMISLLLVFSSDRPSCCKMNLPEAQLWLCHSLAQTLSMAPLGLIN